MDGLRRGAAMSPSPANKVATHRFKLGSSVYLIGNRMLGDAVSGPYEILGLLPERDGNFQYRIKSNLERHQRVAQEKDISLT